MTAAFSTIPSRARKRQQTRCVSCRHDGLMLIDEVQRVPDLWLAIKHLVDREIDGTPDGFVDAVFGAGADLRAQSGELRRKEYVGRAARGGYPEAIRRTTPRRRERSFDSYLADLIARDVKQVTHLGTPLPISALWTTPALTR